MQVIQSLEKALSSSSESLKPNGWEKLKTPFGAGGSGFRPGARCLHPAGRNSGGFEMGLGEGSLPFCFLGSSGQVVGIHAIQKKSCFVGCLALVAPSAEDPLPRNPTCAFSWAPKPPNPFTPWKHSTRGRWASVVCLRSAIGTSDEDLGASGPGPIGLRFVLRGFQVRVWSLVFRMARPSIPQRVAGGGGLSAELPGLGSLMAIVCVCCARRPSHFPLAALREVL